MFRQARMAFTSMFALHLLFSSGMALPQGSLAEAGMEQVTLSAAGAVQRASSIMRRHEEALDRHLHNHHHSHPKVMFTALDLNGDGLVSGAELKARAKTADFHIPTTLMERVSEESDDSGISYDEFLKGVDHVVKDHALHGHASIHEHMVAAPMEEMLLKESETPVPVSCGGHTATSCAECPRTDYFGGEAPDHGQTWCHGECEFVGGSCELKGTGHSTESNSDAQNSNGTNASKVFPQTANADIPDVLNPGTGARNNDEKVAPVPDVLNPEITARDEKVIHQAAESGVIEARKEAEQGSDNTQGESDDVEVWLIVVVSLSVILGMCAIASLVALVTYCYLPAAAKDVDGADAPLAEEGEEEGEEVAGDEAGEEVAGDEAVEEDAGES